MLLRETLSFPILCAIVTILTIGGCAKSETAWIDPGRTTIAEVRAQWGEPTRQGSSQVRPQSKVYDYPNGCSFQIDRDTVTTVSCVPSGQEVHLQYWLHRWEGKYQKREPLPGKVGRHGKRIFQLAVPSEGEAVIFDRATERVMRVVRHVR